MEGFALVFARTEANLRRQGQLCDGDRSRCSRMKDTQTLLASKQKVSIQYSMPTTLSTRMVLNLLRLVPSLSI